MTDFRSNRMPSNEGRGLARRAWDGYESWARKNIVPITRPAFEPLARRYSANKVTELVGFWVLWHAYGGYQGLVETLGMPPTTIYRKVKSFRVVFGSHPDEFEFKGLSLDLKKWHNPEDDA